MRWLSDQLGFSQAECVYVVKVCSVFLVGGCGCSWQSSDTTISSRALVSCATRPSMANCRQLTHLPSCGSEIFPLAASGTLSFRVLPRGPAQCQEQVNHPEDIMFRRWYNNFAIWTDAPSIWQAMKVIKLVIFIFLLYWNTCRFDNVKVWVWKQHKKT